MIYRLLLHAPPSPLQAHYLGRSLLDYVLNKEYGIYLNDETIVNNNWGKPGIKNRRDIHYNISYCYKRIVCVVSGGVTVGIDVEKIRPYNIYAAAHVLSKDELNSVVTSSDPDREFFKIWTLKESCIKAVGMGLSFPMKDVIFNFKGNGQAQSNIGDCCFLVMEDEHEYITSVCYGGLPGGAAVYGELY